MAAPTLPQCPTFRCRNSYLKTLAEKTVPAGRAGTVLCLAASVFGTRDVAQQALPRRLFTQPVNGHHRENLLHRGYRASIGRVRSYRSKCRSGPVRSLKPQASARGPRGSGRVEKAHWAPNPVSLFSCLRPESLQLAGHAIHTSLRASLIRIAARRATNTNRANHLSARAQWQAATQRDGARDVP